MIYAVNKRTKEHRRDVVVKHPDWVTVEATPDGWVPWHGGECPLPDDCRVEVFMECKESRKSPADGFCWGSAVGGAGKIIAYRPIRSEEDRAVDAMVAIAEHEIEKDGSVANSTQIERCLDAVYAAIRDGKVPGVKLAAADGEEV